MGDERERDPDAGATRHVVAHGHIFKNAGTTFDWSLRRTFGDGFLDHRDDEPMRREGAAYLGPFLTERPTVVAISSHHLCYPLPELPGTTFHRCYLLRHPVARAWSAYQFERGQPPSTPGSIEAKRRDFPDYVAWRMDPDVANTIRNHQATYLAGRKPGPTRRHPERTMRAALENLATAHLGVVDRYDESMVVIEHGLAAAGVSVDLAYVPQNVGRTSVSSVDRAVAECLERLGSRAGDLLAANVLDLRLYHRANVELDRRIEQVPGFDGELAAFRARCRALRPAAGSDDASDADPEPGHHRSHAS